jgi:Tfp pilus assembly protein PilN
VSFLSNNQAGANAAMNNASFLPADYIQRKTELRNNIIIGVLFICVLAGVGFVFLRKTAEKKRLANEYSLVKAQCDAEVQKIDALKKLQEQRSKMMEKAELTAALIERVPRWALLSEVVYRAPGETRLANFELKGVRSGGGSVPVLPVPSMNADPNAPSKPRVLPPTFSYDIVITGAAQNNEDVADFLTSLQSSPVLRGLQLTYIKEFKDQDKVVRQFEFIGRLRQNVDKKKLADSVRAVIAAKIEDMNKPKDDDNGLPKPSSPETTNPAAKGVKIHAKPKKVSDAGDDSAIPIDPTAKDGE